MNKHLLLPLLIPATGLLLLVGCTTEVAVRQPPVRDRVVVVHDAPPNRPPPPIIVEQLPPPPPQPVRWVKGHWQWNGHDYFWVKGHYQPV